MSADRPDADREPEAPLPRNVKVLGAVSLAQDTGSEMLYPLLPTFITVTLGAPVVALGVVEGLADAASAGMKLLAGRLSHTHRRRRWIAAGYGLATVGKIIVAAAFVWPVVMVGRFVDRVGKGIRGVPRDALIADVTPPAQRGRAFGLHRSLDTLGAVIGPLIGLALLRALNGDIRPALVVAVIPATISVLLVGFVREQREPAQPDATQAAVPTPRPELPGGFWRVMVPLTVFALVNSTDALLLQRAHELGLSVNSVVVVYVLYNLVYAMLGYPAGKLADRIPPRLVYATGLIVFAVVYVGLGQTPNSTVVWILLPCYGAYTALTDGVSRAWISNLANTEQRTWALGVHGASTGVGTLIAGLWAGLAWGGTGQLPLTISGCVALLVAFWLLTTGQVREGEARTRRPTG